MYGFGDNLPFNTNVNFEDINTLIPIHTRLMLDRTRQLFTWKNLPESISEKWLEIYLQTCGFVILADVPDVGVKIFFGSAGNVLDEYYKPSHAIVNNPFLSFNKDMVIWREYHSEEFDRETMCLIGSNDTMQYGLLPLIQKYAIMLATNEITLNVADINSRAMNIIAAGSDQAFESVKAFLRDLKAGKLAHIRKSKLSDNDVTSLPFAQNTNNGITNLIELHQYYKASFYNEIGLNANYNMKRESIQQNESDNDHDSLKPLIDDMLECRKDFAEQINKHFGLNVEVEFNSIWRDKELLDDMKVEAAEAEVEAMEESSQEPEEASQESEEVSREDETEDQEENGTEVGDIEE